MFSVSGPLSFAVFLSFLFSQGRFFGKIFGSELLFLGGCVGLVFFGGFLLMFLLIFWRFAPEPVWKNSLDVRSGFFWVVLSSLAFSPTSFFVFWLFFFERDKDQVVTGHPSHALVFLVFFLFASRRFCLFCPFWPCVLLFGVFLGVDLLRPFLGTRGGKGFPVLLLSLWSFSPFCLFCGYTF